jgi:hypothetical protein
MRYLLQSILISCIVMACNSPVKGRNGVSYKNAVEYNDYIVNRQTSLMKKILAFGKAAQVNPDSAETLLGIYEKETDIMITELQGMPPFKKDSSLRDAAIRSFVFYKRVFGEDYKQIMAIRKKVDLSAEDAESEANVIVERLSKDEEGFDKTFQKAQRNFAEKNNMKLRENEIQKEVEKLKE